MRRVVFSVAVLAASFGHNALAQCSDTKATTTLSAASDAISLGAVCPTFLGAVSVENTEVELTGVKEINQTLSIRGLESGIDVSVHGDDLESLRSLRVDADTRFGLAGAVNITLPNLRELDGLFVKGEWGFRSSITVSLELNATGIMSLSELSNKVDVNLLHASQLLIENIKSSGISTIETPIRTLRILDVEDNLFTNLTLADLEEVRERIRIRRNPQISYIHLGVQTAFRLSIKDAARETTLRLPRLTTIGRDGKGELSIFHMAKIELPNLRTVHTSGGENSLIISENLITSLDLDALDYVNGSTFNGDVEPQGEMLISDNNALSYVSIPRATFIEELNMRNNPLLKNVTANVLKKAGSISLRGNFTNVEFFSLEEVNNFGIHGDPSMDCSWFDENFVGKVVKFSYSCIGNHTKPSIPRQPSTPTTLAGVDTLLGGLGDGSDESDIGSEGEEKESIPSGGLSKGAKAGIGVGVSIAGVLLIAAGVWAFLRRKKVGASSTQGKSKETKAGVAGGSKPPSLTGPAELHNAVSAKAVIGATAVEVEPRTELHAEDKQELEPATPQLFDSRARPVSELPSPDGVVCRAELPSEKLRDPPVELAA